MTWLTVLQFANYLIPLLIIPYIVRVLGADVFGKVSYAQNIISYLSIIITYGFEYSATQEIAINKEDKTKLRSIFWSVMKFKGLLLLITFIILIILNFCFSRVEEDRLLFFYAALVNIGCVLFPTWFFQGIEKMSKMTLFNFLIKSLGAIFVILLIRSKSDYLIYLLVPSISYIIIGALSFVYVVRKYELIPETGTDIFKEKAVRKGFPIFLNNIFATLYTTAGMTILGFFIPNKELGIFSGANKIIMAVLMVTSMPISVAIFPVISRKFNESFEVGVRFFKRTLVLVGLFAALCSLTIYFLAPLLVHILLGKDFQASIPILQLYSVIPFLVIIASMFTVQGMYGFQLQKYAPYIGGTIGIFSIIINFVLIPRIGVFGAVWSYIFCEFMEIILVLLLLKYKLKNFDHT